MRLPLRWALSLLTALGLVIAPVARAAAEATAGPPAAQAADDDLLLFAVQLDRMLLCDGLTGLAREDGVFLPLGGLCRLLDLAISVTPEAGRAEGFILDERRRFLCDVANGQITVDNQTRTMTPAQVVCRHDDLYVDSRLLSDWLPATLDVDRLNALIQVRAREPLPAQQRLARDQQRQTPGEAPRIRLPDLDTPYQLWSVPAVDPTVSLLWRHSPLGDHLGGTYSAYATGDLLFGTASLYVTGSDLNWLSDLRATLGRKDPNGTLLGPLHARQATIGDVLGPGLPLISRGQVTRGLIVSNYPLDRQTQADSHTFQGTLLPGWEVELYRNRELIGYQRPDQQGTYRFTDVPLLVGTNEFRLVFYGPQGQRHEDVQQFRIDGSFTAPGEHLYRVTGGWQPDGSVRAQAEYDLGLTKQLSGSLSAASLVIGGSQQAFAKAGLRGYWQSWYGHTDFAVSSTGGLAGEAGVQMALGPLGLAVKHALLKDFASEPLQSDGQGIRNRTTLTMNGLVPLSPAVALPLTLSAIRDQSATGLTQYTASGRFGATFGGLSFANQVDCNVFSGGSGSLEPQLGGNLLIGGRIQRFGLHGQLFYTLQGISDCAVSFDAPIANDYRCLLTSSYGLVNQQIRLSGNVNRLSDPVAVGLNVDYGSKGEVGIGLNLSLGLSFEPQQRRWLPRALPAAESGGVSVAAFLDRNHDGHRDAGEPPLPGLGIGLEQNGNQTQTGSDGIAFLGNLPSYRDTTVTISTDGLENPFWTTPTEGWHLMPRPGRTTTIEVPVQLGGEVSGTVVVNRQGAQDPIGAIRLQVIDDAGRVVKETRSEYDGFFTASGLPPGTYSVRIAPEQARQLRLMGTAPGVAITADSLIAGELNLVLQPLAEAAAPARDAAAAAGGAS